MTILARLWIYQSERFPLKKTGPLLGVYSAASICVSAQLADRPLPGWPAFAVGFVLAMALFFQMRVCDEFKDAEDDRRYRPERPVPRGLVSLTEVLMIGILTLPLAAVSAWMWHPPVLWYLILVWVWLAAMTTEFGAPVWLKARPGLYLVSHMAIMPLINLLLTCIEWLPADRIPSKLWVFLVLSFVNGCILEIGRKLWSPETEIAGVDTYSRLWGYRAAALVWLWCVLVSLMFMVTIGFATGVGWVTIVAGGAAIVPCGLALRTYMAAPTAKAQDRMDRVSGLWVFYCYFVVGFLPFLSGGF